MEIWARSVGEGSSNRAEKHHHISKRRVTVRWARTTLRAEPQDNLHRGAQRCEAADQLLDSNVPGKVLLAAWFVRAKPL